MTGPRTAHTAQLRQGCLEIVDAIYASVSDPTRWNDVVAVTARTFGGQVSVIHRWDGPKLDQRLLATVVDRDYALSYETYYGAINPWAVAATGARPAIHLNDGPVEASKVDRSEFYADWLRPQGDLRYPFNLCVRVAPDESVELTTTRQAKAGPFTPVEHQALTTILPHFKRAVDLSRRLAKAESRQAASILACNRSGGSLILVNARRQILFIDPQAERSLGAGALTVSAGIIAALPPFDARFDEAVALATGDGHSLSGRAGTILQIPRRESAAISVAVGPVDERDQPPGMLGPLAMIIVGVAQSGRSPQGGHDSIDPRA